MSKVSVIIAAYNVEKYIASCMDSMINQTLHDIEIIAVNDCSTDGTLAILQKYAQKDIRVKVLTNAVNSGTLTTRKNGSQAATSPYIMFLDGDDYYSPDACEKAYDAITSQGVDYMHFGTYAYAESTDITREDIKAMDESLAPEKANIKGSDDCGIVNYRRDGKFISISVLTKIYRSDIIRFVNENLPEERVLMTEDTLFSYLAQTAAKSYGYIEDKLYNYRMGIGVSTEKALTPRRLEATAKSYFVYDYLKKWTERRGTADQCSDRLAYIKEHVLYNIAYTLQRPMPDSAAVNFAKMILQYCPVEDFITAIEFACLSHANVKEDRYAQICAALTQFTSRKQNIKTIGTFYYRMKNGGVEKVISLLSQKWVSMGYKVVLFTDEAPDEQDYETPPEVKRVVIPQINGRSVADVQKRVVALRNACRENQIDAMVYHAWAGQTVLNDLLSVKSCNVPVIVYTHGLFCAEMANKYIDNAYRNMVLHKIYTLADMVTALTDVDVAWWESKGLISKKVVNPVEISDEISPAALNGHNMLFVGRIAPEKQVIDCLKIAQKVHDALPDAKLTIVGEGDITEYIDQVHEYVTVNHMESYVDFAGYCSNVWPFYKSADVIISTSRYEGFGLTILESKLCGLPMVAYDLPNLDTFRQPDGIKIVPQGECDTAAQEVIEILTNKTLKEELSLSALKSGKTMADIDIAKIWRDIFDAIGKGSTFSAKPKSEIDIATDLMADFVASGTYNIMSRGNGGSEETVYYMKQCNALNSTIEEIRGSTAYRLGLAITSLPRKIKGLFKHD